MGEAKKRGTFEERKAAAKPKPMKIDADFRSRLMQQARGEMMSKLMRGQLPTSGPHRNFVEKVSEELGQEAYQNLQKPAELSDEEWTKENKRRVIDQNRANSGLPSIDWKEHDRLEAERNEPPHPTGEQLDKMAEQLSNRIKVVGG